MPPPPYLRRRGYTCHSGYISFDYKILKFSEAIMQKVITHPRIYFHPII